MGVSALAAGTIACALNARREAEISLLDYGKQGKLIHFPHQGKTVPIRLVNIRFSKKFWLKNNIARLIVEAVMARLIPFAGLRRAWIRRNAWLAHVDDMGVVAAISGGDSFSDIYGLVRFIYVSLPQALALLMRKRLVLLPQTMGPFKGRIARWGARCIIRNADAVYSRDRLGPGVVESLFGSKGEPVKVRFCNDVAFALEPRVPAYIDCEGIAPEEFTNGNLAGVNVSGLLFSRGHQWSGSLGLQVDYRTLVLKLIEMLIRDKNVTVLLVPHVFGEGGESDPPACRTVYESLKDEFAGRIGMVTGRYDQSEIKHIIGRCHFFIGSRMHACIAAVSQCVPAVSIAYSDKFTGVMETAGVESLVPDPRKMSEEEILEIVDQAYDRRGLIRQKLQQTIPAIKERVLGLFDEIAGAGEGAPATSGVRTAVAAE